MMTETEYFEIFADDGRSLGLAARDRVHREGFWHRAAHVWLFTSDGSLWLQQRATAKDVCPGRWDFSVGEHLRPGESFAEAAARGLEEELDVTGIALTPIAAPRRIKHEDPARGIRDWEETQAFRGRYDGAVQFDRTEVMAVRRCAPRELTDWMRREPGAFTPWFIDEARALGVLGDAD
jgi:isopentenyl-diphosphate Delta-isomerase